MAEVVAISYHLEDGERWGIWADIEDVQIVRVEKFSLNWQDSSYNWARQMWGQSPYWGKDSEILNPSLVKMGGYGNVNYDFTLFWKLSEQMVDG